MRSLSPRMSPGMGSKDEVPFFAPAAKDCGVGRMNPVVQQDTTGCGIASVAALAGVTYLEAKEAAAGLGIQVTDSRLWSGTAFVRTLLKHYDIVAEPHERPFRSWRTLPPLALLAIKWHRKGNHTFWHWVIFWRDSDRPVVLDPKRSLKIHVRTDFGRMKPKWFMTISHRKFL